MKGFGIFYYFLLFTISITAFGRPSLEERLLRDYPYRGPKLSDSRSFSRDQKPVALYVGKGAWDTGVAHLKMFFEEHQLSYRSLTAKQILEGKLTIQNFSVLVMPGGESWNYLAALGEKGAQSVKRFVAEGGGYAGICAGAFYAVSHREGGYATGPYGIGLLEGTAFDGTALEKKPFIEGMISFDVLSHPLATGLSRLFQIVLLGGPSFRYTAQEAQQKSLSVLMNFQEINEPAMITFTTGRGRVFLSGPHLEVEEDRTVWEYSDPDSEWPLLERVMNWLMGRVKL